MNKLVIVGIIAVIIILGVSVGYSVGLEKQEQPKVDDQVETTETPQGRNITIELSDGLNFSTQP